LSIDSAGNVGVGVTPSNWNSSAWKTIQLHDTANIWGFSNPIGTNMQVGIGVNTVNENNYVKDGFASMYKQVSGGHHWFTAPSGTAGNPITWTERMRIDNNGNFNIFQDLIHNSAMTYSANKLDAITTDSWAQVAKITFSSTSVYRNGEVKIDCFIGGNSGINGGYVSLTIKYKQQATTRVFSIQQLANTTGTNAVSYYYYDEATLTLYVYVRVLSYSTVRVTTMGEKGLIYDGTIVRVEGTLPVGSVMADLPIYAKYYTKGAGTSGIDSSILYPLFPAANDTLALGVGTYKISMNFTVIVEGSTVSASVRLNMKGAGTAVGNIMATSRGNASSGGNAIQNFFNSSIATTLVVTSTTSVASRIYTVNVEGMIDITTAGTIIPSYSFGATLTDGTVTLSAGNHMVVEKISNTTTTNIGWV
jgi:hypothetical protein